MTPAPDSPGLASAIYRGTVHHRRFEPTEHRFSYRLFLLYLDLDELDRVFAGRWLWSIERPNLASFRRADYLGDPDRPLRDAVLDRVAASGAARPAGPVRMLTHVRYFGYCFNPVTFYYCFDATGSTVEAVVAEITNTPWGERHAYVVARQPGDDGGVLEAEFQKDFHVSPFFGMDHVYRWRFTEPGASLGVAMENRRLDRRVFDATLGLRRQPLTGRALAGALVRHPFMTGKVIAAIYWQALRLKLKRVPVHPHPRSAGRET